MRTTEVLCDVSVPGLLSEGDSGEREIIAVREKPMVDKLLFPID